VGWTGLVLGNMWRPGRGKAVTTGPLEDVVLKGGRQFLNATLDEIETLGKNLELAHERFHAQDQRRDGIDILGKRAGTGEDIETFVEALFTAAAVSFPKGLERRWARLAKRLQGWPSLQKFTVHGTPEVFAQQLEGLRKVEFEKGLEPVGKCRAFIYEGAPMLDQAAQVAHRAAGAFERPQFTMIMECVAAIIAASVRSLCALLRAKLRQ
jgi:hypothetical protein